MSNKEKDNPTSLFGGIKKGVLTILTTPEYREQMSRGETVASEVAPSPKPSPAIHAPVPVVSVHTEDAEHVARKMYEFVERLNQDGIDFFELWNAVEEMGGSTPENLKNAFKVLHVGSGRKLTVEKIETTGRYYMNELQKQVDADLALKQKEKETLMTNRTNEEKNLKEEVKTLEKRIQELNSELTTKRENLSKIDTRYSPELANIDRRIETGKTILSSMLVKMQNILDQIVKVQF